MALQFELALVLLANLRAVIGTAGLLICTYASWRIFQTRNLRNPNLRIWFLLIITGISIALLGRWGRVAILAILIVLVAMLFRVMTRRS